MKTRRLRKSRPWLMCCRRPAFLCRQTNFIINAASQGIPVNIKKGQFLSPGEMGNVVAKARSTGNDAIMVCERGFSFGYKHLVSDMRSLAIMRATGCPVVFDATHSVQLPEGRGHPRAVSANSCRSSRARRLPQASRDYSWRRIRIREGAVGRSERLAALADGVAPRHVEGA